MLVTGQQACSSKAAHIGVQQHSAGQLNLASIQSATGWQALDSMASLLCRSKALHWSTHRLATSWCRACWQLCMDMYWHKPCASTCSCRPQAASSPLNLQSSFHWAHAPHMPLPSFGWAPKWRVLEPEGVVEAFSQYARRGCRILRDLSGCSYFACQPIFSWHIWHGPLALKM